MIADAIEKVGKDGVVNVEEGQTFGIELEFTEGMQFDRGYMSPYMVTDQERMEAVLDDPFLLIHGGKISSRAGHPAPARAGDRPGPAAAGDRRGRRGRGPGDPDRQQAARHLHRHRRQGPRLWRPAQAHARGHRHPLRRRGDQRGDGPQAGKRPGQPAGPGPAGGGLKGRHHHHRRGRRHRGDQGPHQADQGRDRDHRLATSTARSSRSGWPSWPAGWPWSRWAPPPRPR